MYLNGHTRKANIESVSSMRCLLLIAAFAFLCAGTREVLAYEAGYYSFQSPSQLPGSMDSLVMRATQVDVPAGANFTLRLMKGNQLVSTSRTVFSSAYSNYFVFAGAGVASFRPVGTNEVPGANFPGAVLYPGEANLSDIAQNPSAYSLFWELSDGYIAPTDKMLATAAASFSFVDLSLLSVSAASRQSDQKPGSLLFFHKYTSNLYSPLGINTNINLTNTSISDSVKVRLFFVGAADCTPFDIAICLGPLQSASFSMRDYDPQNNGYCIAFACDATGAPTQFNWLTGNAQIRQVNSLTSQAFDAQINAVAITKLANGSVPTTAGVAEMVFDDTMYDRLPSQLSVDQVQSQAGIGSNANATSLSVYRPLPDLTGGSINPKLTLTATNSNGISTSGSQLIGCYSDIRLGSLRFNPQLSTVLPAGKSGWVRVSADDGGAILGAQFTAGQYSSGSSLRALFFANQYRIKVPVRVPGC